MVIQRVFFFITISIPYLHLFYQHDSKWNISCSSNLFANSFTLPGSQTSITRNILHSTNNNHHRDHYHLPSFITGTYTKSKMHTIRVYSRTSRNANPSNDNYNSDDDTIDTNDNISLQHTIRAPTSQSSSSNTFATQEASFQNEDAEMMQRQAIIQQYLDQDDQRWKEERKRKKMGKYADAKNLEEWKRLMKEDEDRILKENKMKTKIAKQSGVSFSLIEKPDELVYASSSPSSSSSTNTEESSSYKINSKNIKRKDNSKPSWFEGIDDDLNAELLEQQSRMIMDQQLQQQEGNYNDDTDNDNTMNRVNERDSNQEDNNDDEGLHASWLNDADNRPRFVNGEFITNNNEQSQGIRIGSAGGWTLEIFPGDFVVHRKYGIGKFEKTILKPKSKLSDTEVTQQTERRNEIVRDMLKNGFNTTEIEKTVAAFGTESDKDLVSNPQQTVLEVLYSDAIVHIPVDKAYRISRYRAGDAVVKPRLSRVKGEAWSKARRKVEEDTLQMAEDVLALYATRETLARPPFEPSKEVLMRDFHETFPFDPTPDQIKCFEAVENDMVWRSRPMDRLVCGDVGFGKTEVALRALFRCVSNGRQAALLAPTGVLAAQHYKNILKRMGPGTKFNINVSLLRGGMGKNTKVGRAMREDITSGEIQLIVGTHALLSFGIEFKDLGLLVVDEEQRFGVKQKERLKLICNGIDVLTLSATPIPRTLQMSLSGIRDTSTIRSPPPMRKPTITYVQEFDKTLIREAISRELDRGGQCFYVVPRIAQLDEAEKVIKDLFPRIRVVQAHGRMARGAAEDNVAAFAEGSYDVLLATTVIENGVDIPSVNTIIIQNAQAFGMSTLYQLRGRVGRSNLQGYAYFFHQEESITEQSAMRLQAMADLHELGSGFDVANRDLEIRGAGSLLGTEQSGMAATVGFDLYMRMLKKSIRKLRGLDLPMVPRTNVLLPDGEGSLEIAESSDGTVAHAFEIPPSYLKDSNERKIQEGSARLAENTEQLVKLTNQWKKKYGPLPAVLQSKLKTLHLHACTRTLGIDLIGLHKSGKGKVDCVLRSPGLRPRHLTHISQFLPGGVLTKGINVIFPSRFCNSDDNVEVVGGKQVNIELFTQRAGEDEEEWDAFDQEEVEAMKEISSAMLVRSLDDIEIEDYPRFVVKNFHKINVGSRVDVLLKVLLPASKVVYEKQQADKEKAKVAAELREKRELMKQQLKEQDALRRMKFSNYLQ